MKKQVTLWKSKTVWGFGIALVIIGVQQLGVNLALTDVAEIVKTLSEVLGVVGLRDALK